MGAITEIFRAFGPEYMGRYPHLPQQHRKVIAAIINCRSGEYGAAFYRCESCGQRHQVDRSCGNRHCPQCQYHKTRQWLKAQLEKNGVVAIQAFDGNEALKLIEQDKPDLIILDLMIPKKNGFWVLEEIRKNNAFSKIPIL